MKKGLYLTIVLVVMAVLAGCKNELQQVSGEYSYKISGNAIVDSTEVHLTNESGALHIIDKDEKELLLTFNMLAGDVYTTNAELSAKVLKINEFERVIMHNAKNYKIKVTGEGNVYDSWKAKILNWLQRETDEKVILDYIAEFGACRLHARTEQQTSCSAVECACDDSCVTIGGADSYVRGKD